MSKKLYNKIINYIYNNSYYKILENSINVINKKNGNNFIEIKFNFLENQFVIDNYDFIIEIWNKDKIIYQSKNTFKKDLIESNNVYEYIDSILFNILIELTTEQLKMIIKNI